MGQPSIQIQFQTAAKESISLLSKGNLGIILRDENGAGAHIITGVDEIPKEITAANQGYLQRALIGSDNRPQKVFAYVLTADGEMGEALQYFSTQNVDYLCPPPEGEEADVTALIDWVKKQREDQRIYKAVVANQAADCEGVINFTTAGIQAGEQTYTAAQYVSRIAGILVGGAVKGSCTYKPLLEVADFTRLANKAAEDAAADKGELILLHDGRKAKLGRGVNSLTTTGADKGGMLKKIKIVETKDRITYDLRLAVEDHYIGKYNNDYSEKNLAFFHFRLFAGDGGSRLFEGRDKLCGH